MEIFGLLSFEILLPFLLVLAVVYGALGFSDVFKNRGVNAVISLVFAFFAIMNYQVVQFINQILPYAAGFFVVIFLVWIVLKPLRGDKKEGRKIDPVALIVILVLILIAFASLGSADYFPQLGFLQSENFLWGIGIIVVLVIIWKAYKMGSAGE